MVCGLLEGRAGFVEFQLTDSFFFHQDFVAAKIQSGEFRIGFSLRHLRLELSKGFASAQLCQCLICLEDLRTRLGEGGAKIALVQPGKWLADPHELALIHENPQGP